MRRSDREVSDRDTLVSILDQAVVCRLALHAEPAPYIVPMNYGYSWDEGLELYFHSAPEGRKLDLLGKNPWVGFEIDEVLELVKADQACGWGLRYRSIVGTGRMVPVEPPQDRVHALNHIMRRYGFEGEPVYDPKVLSRISVWKLLVETLSGKAR